MSIKYTLIKGCKEGSQPKNLDLSVIPHNVYLGLFGISL